jgi:two-component system cell cycle response regulator
MNLRYALPGLGAGVIGLLFGLFALIADQALLGAVAGLFALVAGAGSVRLAKQLDELTAVQALTEAELRSVKAGAAGGKGPVPTAEGDGSDSSVRHPALGDDTDEPAELIDPATGLFSESFFLVALDSRIAAARRHLRPIAMVLIEVVEGLPTDDPSDVEATIVAETIKETLREADTACRLRNGYFALLLEDTPENGAIWTVERIRRQLAELRDGLTVWAGVACYPAHAFSSDEILIASEQALVAAREWRQDRIEVAAAAE